MNQFNEIPAEFYNLPFYLRGTNPEVTNSLTDSACELIWHLHLIHCEEHSFRDIHKHVDGAPNLNKIKFNDRTICATCLKTNITKSPVGHKSFYDSLTTPHQGLYVDLGFPGRITEDKYGNIIKSTHKDIEGLISDGKTRMLYGDAGLIKSSALKYLKFFFLTKYAPACKNKWVVLDQG